MMTAKLRCTTCGARSKTFYGSTGRKLSDYVGKAGWSLLSSGESICPRCTKLRVSKGQVKLVG